MNTPNLVTVDFSTVAVCEEAEGLRGRSLRNAKATGVISIKGGIQDIQQGAGPVAVSGTLTTLTRPDGSDGLPALKGRLDFDTVYSVMLDHRVHISKQLAGGGLTLTVDAKFLNRGRLVLGTASVVVNKWLWRLMLKRASGSFQGTLQPATT